MKRFWLRLVCFFKGHVVNEGEYIDSHDCWDGISFCERCGCYEPECQKWYEGWI